MASLAAPTPLCIIRTVRCGCTRASAPSQRRRSRATAPVEFLALTHPVPGGSPGAQRGC